MTVLIVIGAILLFFLIIGLIPLGAGVEYSSDGLILEAVAGPVRIRLVPKSEAVPKKKKDKPKTKKKKKDRKKKGNKPLPEGGAGEKKGGMPEKILQVLPTVFQTLGRFLRSLTIRELTVRYTVGGEDPSRTAIQYGAMSGGMQLLEPLLSRMRIRKRDIRFRCDFTREKDDVYVKATAVIMIWQLIYIVLKLDFRAIFRLLK
ncbi:MAG: hypothetical protein K6C09_03295 [Oscillospiraceae bacterium]|nr:hypothetical protein [Oscillospiraceae bacterium]